MSDISGQVSGNIYKTTDGPWNFIFDGSKWQAYFNDLQAYPIITANWTTLGSGGKFKLNHYLQALLTYLQKFKDEHPPP